MVTSTTKKGSIKKEDLYIKIELFKLRRRNLQHIYSFYISLFVLLVMVTKEFHTIYLFILKMD